MTWEELTKKYDKESEQARLMNKNPGLERGWDSLMRSTDKLLWLFKLSSASSAKQAKAAKR